MKSINRALIPPQHKVFLWKFINKALYIGEVGYSYQIHVKHVNPANSLILVPNFCIYSHYILIPYSQPPTSGSFGIPLKLNYYGVT